MDDLISLAVEVNSAYEACLEAGVESSKICHLRENVELACGLLNSGMAMEALDVASKHKIDISEESLRELGKKAIDAIIRLIEKVIDFFKSLIAKIKAFFSKKSEVVESLDELAKEARAFVEGDASSESLTLTETSSVVSTIEKYMHLTRELIHASTMCSRINHEICADISNWLSSGDTSYITKNLSNALYLEGGPQIKLDNQMVAIKDIFDELEGITVSWKALLKSYLDPKVSGIKNTFKSMRDEFLRNSAQMDVSNRLMKIHADLKSASISSNSDVYHLVTTAIRQCTSNCNSVICEFGRMEHKFSKFLKKRV